MSGRRPRSPFLGLGHHPTVVCRVRVWRAAAPGTWRDLVASLTLLGAPLPWRWSSQCRDILDAPPPRHRTHAEALAAALHHAAHAHRGPT